MCSETQTRLTEDLENRFSEPISAHLRRCPQCRALCQDLMQLERLSRELASIPEVPSSYSAQVLAKASSSRGLSRRAGWRLGVAAGVLLGAAVGTFTVWSDSEPPVRQASSAPVEGPSLEIPTGETPLLRESPYVDVILEETPNGEMRLRLPSVIEIRQNEFQEEFYVQHVSH